jgi:PPOX class probable F420-dependent enzyme
LQSPRASRPKFRGLPILPEDEGSGLVPWGWAVERLEAARSYWVATTRPDGSPHAMPVWGVWLDRALYFDTHPQSQKVRNLTHEPRAVVHLESADDVVILEGTIDVDDDVEEGELFERIAAAYESKYGNKPFGAFSFHPRIGYVWRNKDFVGSATRFAFGQG